MNRFPLVAASLSLIFVSAASASNPFGFVELEGTPIGGESPAVEKELGELKLAADFNGDGQISVQDLYDFLPEWSVRSEQGLATVQQLYDFLNMWAAGINPPAKG